MLTELHQFATWEGHFEVVKFLSKGMKDKNPKDIYGRTLLHVAATIGNCIARKKNISNALDAD